MRFDLPDEKAKSRCIALAIVCGLLSAVGTRAVYGLYQSALDTLIESKGGLVIDGQNFDPLIDLSAAVLNGALSAFAQLFTALGFSLLCFLTVLVLRLIALRKVYHVSRSEAELSALILGGAAALGMLVSAVLCRGQMLRMLALIHLPGAFIGLMLYVSKLFRLTKRPGYGHFVENTEQDLTDL